MRDVRKTEIVSNIARLPGDEFVSITFSFAIRCYTAHLRWHHTTQRIISWSFFRETSQHATTKICNSKCEIELIQHPNRQYMAIYMEKIKTINFYAGPIQYKNVWLLYGSKTLQLEHLGWPSLGQKHKQWAHQLSFWSNIGICSYPYVRM